MRYGSICSGIEAATVAWEPLGWKPAWFSEIEKFPSAVLEHHYPDVKNIGSMCGLVEILRDGILPAPEIICGGTPCFTADHLVLTGKGYRPIQDLKVGDTVVTHKGRLRTIANIGSKKAQVGRLSMTGMPEGLTCTPDHPFLSSHWRNQSTKRNNKYTLIEHCSDPEWVVAENLPGRQWCALTSIQGDDMPICSTKFTDEQAMYVAGMYLGDGWTRRWKKKKNIAVVLGLNASKLKKLQEVIGDVTVHKERTVFKVTIYDTELALWLERHFQKYSHLKNIPAWIMGHPLKDKFVQGYRDTDGYRINDHTEGFNTTSRELAYGIATLMNCSGYVSSIGKIIADKTKVIEGRTVNQRDWYQVRCCEESKTNYARVRHDYLMRSVKDYEITQHDTVYNIEVVGDHSYIVNGAVVHNCQAFSVAGLRKGLEDARGNLSLEYCNIINEVDRVRESKGEDPCIVFWENVPGVLTSKDNAFGCFLAGLAGEDGALEPPGGKWTDAGCVSGPKRAVAWRVLDAQYFGLAQRRRRVFVVASAREGFDPSKVLFEWEGVRRDIAPSRETREDTASDAGSGASFSCGGIGDYRSSSSSSNALRASGADLGPGCEELCVTGETRGQDPVVACCGVFQQSSMKGRGTIGYDDSGVAKPVKTQSDGQMIVAPCIRGSGNGTARVGDYRGQDPVVAINMEHGLAPHGSLKAKEVVDQILSTEHKGKTIVFNTTQITTQCITGDITHTLKAEGFDESEDGTGRGQPIVPVAFAQNSRDEVRLEGGDGQRTGALSTGGEKPGQGQPMVVVSTLDSNYGRLQGCSGQDMNHGHSHQVPGAMQVRRLTPVECERLQGFPQIIESIDIQYEEGSIVECSDLQKIDVHVAQGCLRSLNNAWHVEEKESHQHARNAADRLNTSAVNLENAARVGVHINCEAERVEIHSPGRSPWYVNTVDIEEWYRLSTRGEGSVQFHAKMHSWLESIHRHGGVESHQSMQDSLPRLNGEKPNNQCGPETEEYVASVEKNISEAMRCLRSITSSHGPSILLSDSTLKILCYCAAHAMTTFTQSTINETSLLNVRLSVEYGYTQIPWRGKPAEDCPDGPRYKALGNSWAVPVVRWIGRRIQDHLHSLASNP